MLSALHTAGSLQGGGAAAPGAGAGGALLLHTGPLHTGASGHGPVTTRKFIKECQATVIAVGAGNLAALPQAAKDAIQVRRRERGGGRLSGPGFGRGAAPMPRRRSSACGGGVAPNAGGHVLRRRALPFDAFAGRQRAARPHHQLAPRASPARPSRATSHRL